MRSLTAVLVTLVLTVSTASAQRGSFNQIKTHPILPPQDALDRLHLKLAWRLNVPMDGSRDGIYSVQVLANQVLVQTRSGTLLAVNPEDGTTQWRTRVGDAYKVANMLAYNSASVFALRGTTLFALDRKTGQLQWMFAIPGGASTHPVAEEGRIYLALGTGRIYVYALPRLDKQALEAVPPVRPPSQPDEGDRSVRYAGKGLPVASVGPLTSASQANQAAATGPQPLLLFETLTPSRLEQPPLMSQGAVVLAGTDGQVIGFSRDSREVLFAFQAQAALSTPGGPLPDKQGHDIAYFPSQDYNLYALDMAGGNFKWRFTSAGPILHKPQVIDEDIFVTPAGAGLYRLDRESGDVIWRNFQGDRFLATNRKFVYATDRDGNLMVLDRARGTKLAGLETRDYVMPIANEWTDRIYLASHDGQLVCLYDRDYAQPLRVRQIAGKAPDKPAPAKPPVKAPADKGEEKMQEK